MTVDELQAFLDGAFPGPRTNFVVEACDDRHLRLRLPVDITHSRPGGTVSGPTLMALADCAAWLVIVAQIGPVALSVTTSLHIDFFRKPAIVDAVAVGTLLKLGSRLAVVDVGLFSDIGRGAGAASGPFDVPPDVLVAKAQVTYSIPPDHPAG
jgi:uncharacterized protein (TIGR00369 family)